MPLRPLLFASWHPFEQLRWFGHMCMTYGGGMMAALWCSIVVVGYCAGGKSPKGQADRQPFFWYVDSSMGVNGTTNLWLWHWAEQRLGKQWIFPEYTLRVQSKGAGAPWQRPGIECWLITGVWNRLLSLN